MAAGSNGGRVWPRFLGTSFGGGKVGRKSKRRKKEIVGEKVFGILSRRTPMPSKNPPFRKKKKQKGVTTGKKEMSTSFCLSPERADGDPKIKNTWGETGGPVGNMGTWLNNFWTRGRSHSARNQEKKTEKRGIGIYAKEL